MDCSVKGTYVFTYFTLGVWPTNNVSHHYKNMWKNSKRRKKTVKSMDYFHRN